MKKGIRKIVFLSILLFIGVDTQAQLLDLETCLKMADTANLSIRNARLDVAINQKQISANKAALYPKLVFSGDYKYNAKIPGQLIPAEVFGGTPGTYATVQFGVPYNFNNAIQLTQTIYNPQLNYALTALKIQEESTKIQQRITEQDIHYQVANTYFSLQAITKQLNYTDSNLVNTEQLIKNMQLRADQELILQTEVDKLQINRLSLINSKESLLATKEQLELNLRILTGMSDQEVFQLATDNAVEKTILNSPENATYPDIELIETQQRLNSEERKGTNMAYLPTLSLYGGYNYSYNVKPETNYRTGIESAFVGIKLDWTLFDGLEKANNQKVNALNADKLANQKSLLQQQLEQQKTTSKRQVEVQLKALDVTKEQLRLAENIYQQTKVKYEQGLASSTDLLLADNSLQEAQTNTIAAYLRLRQAELDYLKVIGNMY